MKYHFKTTDGRFLVKWSDLLYHLSEDRSAAAEFDSELEASLAFLRLPKFGRNGVSGSPVPVVDEDGPTPEELEAGKVFMTCSALLDNASETIRGALQEMMDAYLVMTKRLREDNAEMKHRLDGLSK